MTILDEVNSLLLVYQKGIYDEENGKYRDLTEEEVEDLIRRIIDLGLEKEEVQNALAEVIYNEDLDVEMIAEIKEEILKVDDGDLVIVPALEDALNKVDESEFVDEINDEEKIEQERPMEEQVPVNSSDLEGVSNEELGAINEPSVLDSIVDNTVDFMAVVLAAGFVEVQGLEFAMIEAVLSKQNIRDITLLAGLMLEQFKDLNIVLERRQVGEKAIDVIMFSDPNLSFEELAMGIAKGIEMINQLPKESRKYNPEIMLLLEEFKRQKKQSEVGVSVSLEEMFGREYRQAPVGIDLEDTLELPDELQVSNNNNLYVGEYATVENVCKVIRENVGPDLITGDLPTLSVKTEGDKRIVTILSGGESSQDSKEVAQFVFEGNFDLVGQNIFDTDTLPKILHEYAMLNVLDNQNLDQEFEDVLASEKDVRVISADRMKLELDGFPKEIADDSMKMISDIHEEKKKAVKSLTVDEDKRHVISSDYEGVTLALGDGEEVYLNNEQVNVLDNQVKQELVQAGVLSKAVQKEKNDDFSSKPNNGSNTSSSNAGISDAELLFYMLTATITIIAGVVWYLMG